jgi:folate-binding protein YgfZ
LTKTSLLLPLHRGAAAELSTAEPQKVLAFGEVPDEYAAAHERAVLFDQTDRDALAVAGPDAAQFLHRLLANSVKTLEVGRGNRNLLLSSKGKVLFDFDLAVEPERIVLSLVPGTAQALAKSLDTYHFSEKLTLKDASAEHAPIAVCGPHAARIVVAVLGLEPPREDHRSIRARFESHEVVVTALPVAGSPGWRIDGDPALAAKLWSALIAAGATPAGRIAYDSLRVEAGAAEPGVDIDDNVYPQEARIEAAFSLDKGCYIGQEVIAKIDTYGGLNKRLVALKVSHDDPVARGARLWRDDEGEWRDLGLVTSWAYSFVLDTGLVLAFVKRRHQAPGTVFRLGDPRQPSGEAVVVALPVRANALPLSGEFE